jgi:hypothetical protein
MCRTVASRGIRRRGEILPKPARALAGGVERGESGMAAQGTVDSVRVLTWNINRSARRSILSRSSHTHLM